MTKYYLETPTGSLEISRHEYMEFKIKSLFNEPMDYAPYMKYVDVDTCPQWRLPNGV